MPLKFNADYYKKNLKSNLISIRPLGTKKYINKLYFILNYLHILISFKKIIFLSILSMDLIM